MAYTEEDLKGLSPEERAALAEDKDDVEALQRIADEDETVDDDDVVKADAAEEAKPETKIDEAVSKPVVEAPKEEVAAFMPEYKAEEVADYVSKMSEFSAQKAALRVALNDGELTHADYDDKKDAIIAEEQALRELKLKYEIAVEQNEQNAIARWNWEQERFFSEDVNAVYKDKYLLAAFDSAVRDLGSKTENANQPGHWFLKEADKLVRSRFNTGETKVDEPKVETKPKESRKPDLSMVPKSLAHLPAAEIQQTGDVDEFAHIDRLKGIDLEKAIGRMSEAERERFRASA